MVGIDKMKPDIRLWQVFALGIIIAGVLLTVWTAQYQDEQLRRDLLVKARIATENIDPAMVNALNGSLSDITSPDYQHLKVQMARIRAADPSIRFAYLMGQRPGGPIFYVDSEPAGSKDYSPPGQVYSEVTSPVLEAFSNNMEMTEGPYTDRWGTWVSAFVPVKDQETGELVALFGMDMDARSWNYTIAMDSAAIITASLLILVLIVIFGLTQRRSQREQRHLKASEDKFFRAFNTNPALMAVSSVEEGRLLDVNVSFQETLGYSREELIGRKISDIGLYSDPAQWEAIQRQLKETGYVGNLDVKVIRKNHDMLDGLFSAITIDVAGIPSQLTVVLDITDRKQIERALRESEFYLSSIIRVAPIGIGVVSDRIIQTVNDTLCQMTGYTADELIGKSSRLLYPTQSDFDYVGREKYGQISQKGSGSVETRWQKKDGTIIDILLTSTPVDQSDMAFGVTFTALDLTDRKLAEDSLLRVTQKLNVLSQLTRRDLTNDLFVLNSYLELAMQEAREQDPVIVNLQQCEQVARSIGEITEFTRDYQDLGVKPPAWQNVRVTMLFGLSHLSIGNLQHRIETGDLEIFADPLLEKAFQGLFENSLAHGDHVQRVRIWYTQVPDGVSLFFEDDGIGIVKEEKDQMFFRREGTRASVRGLFFIREILDITGITITETGEPGEGARFEMMVPMGAWRYGRKSD